MVDFVDTGEHSRQNPFRNILELPETEIRGFREIQAELERRRDLASDYLRREVIKNLQLVDLVSASFPEATPAQREEAITRIPTAPYRSGQMPRLWETREDLARYSVKKTKYSRDIVAAKFGQAQIAVFPNVKELFPDIDRRVKQGIVAPPAVLVAYSMQVAEVRHQSDFRPLVGTVVEPRYMHLYWYADPMRDGVKYLQPGMGGMSAREWDEPSRKLLNLQKTQVDQSVAQALRHTQYWMANPYRGGLPGLSGRRSK